MSEKNRLSHFEVTCAIPRTGRTFENFLTHLKTLGVNKEEIDKILDISKQSKNMQYNKCLALVYLLTVNEVNALTESVF